MLYCSGLNFSSGIIIEIVISLFNCKLGLISSDLNITTLLWKLFVKITLNNFFCKLQFNQLLY